MGSVSWTSKWFICVGRSYKKFFINAWKDGITRCWWLKGYEVIFEGADGLGYFLMMRHLLMLIRAEQGAEEGYIVERELEEEFIWRLLLRGGPHQWLKKSFLDVRKQNNLNCVHEIFRLKKKWKHFLIRKSFRIKYSMLRPFFSSICVNITVEYNFFHTLLRFNLEVSEKQCFVLIHYVCFHCTGLFIHSSFWFFYIQKTYFVE